MYALTAIPGMGRRISNVVCKKAEVDMRKRAGDLSADEIERIVSIVSDPKKFKVRAGPCVLAQRRQPPPCCAACGTASRLPSRSRLPQIPTWMVNRRRDRVDGKSGHLTSNQIATKLREDIEALKKVRAHRGLRHYWGLKVRGQHTGTTGRGRAAAMAAAQ